MTTEHRLIGLEIDNLLGFMALLGLLRALERSTPRWNPRAYFTGTPLTAHLVLTAEASKEQVSEAAADGCAAFAPYFAFGNCRDLNFSGDIARTLLAHSQSDADRSLVMSALCSDAATKGKDKRVIPTPLCAMFGQGHQSFLSRLTTVSAGTPPRVLASRKLGLDLNDPSYILRSLFAPWTRSDPTESFRWDYTEDRQYALRYADPSSDPPTTEHGANRLAVLGLLSVQTAPVARRVASKIPGEYGDLRTRAASRGRKDRRQRITWPIWEQPASLEAIHTMLDDSDLGRDEPTFQSLGRYGVRQARRVYRTSRGKYVSFSRAEPIVAAERGQQ